MKSQQKIDSIKSTIKAKKQETNKIQKTINYTQLRTLKNYKPQHILPGLEYKNKSFIHKKRANSVNNNYCQQPTLLTTAVKSIKKQYQETQNDDQQKSLQISHYFNSRQITPINPLLGGSFLNSSNAGKKRMKTHQTNKSRLQSITSELHEMESQLQSAGQILPAYKQKGFQLYNHVLGQSEAAYHYAFGKQKKIPQKLIYLWKQCLYHQDKAQVFVPINPEQSSSIPYTHPRIFPLNELEKGFQEVYGTGKHRCLKAGEQALIIEGIEKYLQKCNEQPMKIARKDYDIIADILADTKLTDLQNYPMCYKQVQGHFKIMATRWRYKNIDNKSNRMFEPAIINGKNNFVDLGKTGILSQYLLKQSNKNQFS